MSEGTNNKLTIIIPILLFTGIYSFFSFFPEGRVWAFNLWSYNSSLFQIVTPIIVISFLFGLYFYGEKSKLFALNISEKSYRLYLTLSIIIIAVLAFFLQAKTYFLGDGYTVLALLSDGNPLYLKERQLGSTYIHHFIFNLLSGDPYQRAVLSYKIISFVSLFLYIFTAIILSNKLFQHRLKRLLFLLGLFTCGNTLMFFGYVENYSLFNITILIFILLGIRLIDDTSKKWLLIPSMFLLVIFHIFGILFIPALIYFFYSNSKIESILNRQSKILKTIYSIGIFALFIIMVGYFYLNDYFIQLSIVPFFQNRFTQEGYLLFSINHIWDFIQLLFILIPGLIFIFFNLSLFKIKLDKKIIFLLISTLSALAGAFIFDPKLGMPRDWDLFSYSVIPMAVLFYIILLKYNTQKKSVLIAVLAIIMGFTVTISRAEIINDYEKGVDQFYSYLFLDKIKNRNSWRLLYDFYQRQNDSTNAELTLKEWKSHFPEEKLLEQANDIYYKEKDTQKAITLLREILEINSTYPDAYGFLGNCYLDINQIDSAITLIRIADALSPNRPNNLNNLGTAYTMKGDLVNAEKYFIRAVENDSINYILPYNLAKLYQKQNRRNEYLTYLEKSVAKDNVPIQLKRELFINYLDLKYYQKAVDFINSDSALKTDSEFIEAVNKRYNGILKF